MVTEFPQITTPFPVATRVHRFKELSRIRPLPGDGNFRITGGPRKLGWIRPAES